MTNLGVRMENWGSECIMSRCVCGQGNPSFSGIIMWQKQVAEVTSVYEVFSVVEIHILKVRF